MYKIKSMLPKLLCIIFVLAPIIVRAEDIKFRYPLNEYHNYLRPIGPFVGGLPLTYISTPIISFFDHDPEKAATSPSTDKTMKFDCEKTVNYDGHNGLDLRTWTKGVTPLADTNPAIPVIAAAPGKVIGFEGACDPNGGYWGNGCGNFVVLEHGADLRTKYWHLSSPIVTYVGQQVSCGEQIGITGNSGHSRGAHLHFGLQRKVAQNVWFDVDPFGYDGSKCGGNSSDKYPSYWYQMEGNSTERPSMQCQPAISQAPIKWDLNYSQQGYAIYGTYFNPAYTTGSDGITITNPVTGYKIQRKLGTNGVWSDQNIQLYYHDGYNSGLDVSRAKYVNFVDSYVASAGLYCYKMASTTSAGLSEYSPESCVEKNDSGSAVVLPTQGKPGKPIVSIGDVYVINLGFNLSTVRVYYPAILNKLILERKVMYDGSWEVMQSVTDPGATMFNHQNSSDAYPAKPQYQDKRVCYRAKVAFTGGEWSEYSDPDCIFYGGGQVAPPTNLRVTAQGTATDPEIKIMFDDNARGETFIKITRKSSLGGQISPEYPASFGMRSDLVVADGNSDSAYGQGGEYYAKIVNSTASQLKPGTKYCYTLTTIYKPANGPEQQSSPSPEVCTTTLGTSPTTLTPPTNLTTPTLGPTALILTWIDTTTTETGFDVERKTGTSGTYTKLSQSPAKSGSGSTGSYISSGLTPNTLYCYRVRAVQNTTYSTYTPDYCITTKPATTVTPPSIPTNLSVTLPTTNPSTTLNISFKDTSTNETGFEIERKTGAGGTYTQLTTLPLSAGSGTTPTYTSTLLSPSTTYCYRVRALGTTNSAYTADVCTTTAATPSSTLPTNLTVTNPTTNPTTSLQISWKDNSTNETGFDLRRKVGPATSSNSIAGLNQQSKAGSGSTITITSTGLTTKTQYCYQVAAKPMTAQSVYTPWVCGVTK
jgi:murein DD-endopeptidase MepM/ murein hydrolase activator NlpD